MSKLLKDQAAVVTGASSGVGRTVALALAAEGAAVCLLGRKLETLESVAERARGTEARVLPYQVDLTVQDEILQFVKRLERDLGGIDILVHGAGVIFLGPIESASSGELDAQIRVNLRAPCVLTTALLPMVRARRGQIVFINSTAGVDATANAAYYAAAKHGLKGFADSLRNEVNGSGVRVLTVFLGRTATPMQAAIHEREGRPYRPELLIQPEDVASVVVHALTLPKTAEITDVRIRPFIKPSANHTRSQVEGEHE